MLLTASEATALLATHAMLDEATKRGCVDPETSALEYVALCTAFGKIDDALGVLGIDAPKYDEEAA